MGAVFVDIIVLASWDSVTRPRCIHRCLFVRQAAIAQPVAATTLGGASVALQRMLPTASAVLFFVETRGFHGLIGTNLLA
jgi:hypothetical protein